jgi:hydroxypyruvate reductase
MRELFARRITAPQAEKVDRVITAALRAVDPRFAARAAVSLDGDRLTVGEDIIDLSGFARIRMVGVGKAAPAMARGMLDLLGDRVAEGLLISKHRSTEQAPLPERVRLLTAGHPVPSAESESSARALAAFLRDGTSEDDLLFILISGGGSALMTLPVEGVSLADLQELTRQLLACGADIGEINTLRKHLDQVKGGGLARLAAPARVITLILSDVIGSPLDVIASGPTVADSTTFAQAIDILRKYGIEDQAPIAIRRVLERGARGGASKLAFDPAGLGAPPETVKAGDPILARVTNQIVASNPQAAEAALAEARSQGFHTLLLTTSLRGEASAAGAHLARLLRRVVEEGQPLRRPACIVAGGETTVTLRGGGVGGRNQEMALAAVEPLAGVRDVALVTFATDGEDGPTNAAGAVVTGDSLHRAGALNLDPRAYLENNDSYTFFSALGDLLITGPTGTNVNDLAFLFAF